MRAGKRPRFIRRCVLYSTLSPCPMCSGAILLYKIPRVVIGENVTFQGPEDYVRSQGVKVEVLQRPGVHPAHARFHRGQAGALERGYWNLNFCSSRREEAQTSPAEIMSLLTSVCYSINQHHDRRILRRLHHILKFSGPPVFGSFNLAKGPGQTPESLTAGCS